MVEKINHFLFQQLKNWMLPIAMLIGGIFYSFFSFLAPLTPYLIFVMLLVPYCRIEPSELRISRLHVILILIQVVCSLGLYLLIAPVDGLIAQGALICVLAPTATSAAVITGMLGGSVAVLATYTLVSNLTVAALSPMIFSLIGEHTSMPFFTSFGLICRQMIPLLILPFVLALLMRRFTPRVHRALQQHQKISFYLWAVSLTIVMGNTVAFLARQDASNYIHEVWIAAVAMVVCCAQFYVGRRIGRREGHKVSGAQGLGQKNTVLAIWMAQTYLNPIASIAPASYVIWQNLINSWQLWHKRRVDAIAVPSDIRSSSDIPSSSAA